MSYEQTLSNARSIVQQRDEVITELKRKRQEIDDQLAELQGQPVDPGAKRGRPRKEAGNGADHSGSVEAGEPPPLA